MEASLCAGEGQDGAGRGEGAHVNALALLSWKSGWGDRTTERRSGRAAVGDEDEHEAAAGPF